MDTLLKYKLFTCFFESTNLFQNSIVIGNGEVLERQKNFVEANTLFCTDSANILSTPVQLAAKQRKVEKEKETLIGQ
jgi:hypothetical protein